MAAGDDVQVLIVGGGIGGLALAGFLRQGGIEPAIIEPREGWCGTDCRPTLHGRELAVLDELGVAGSVRDRAARLDAWTVRDPGGEIRARIEPDRGIVAVPRTGLHEQLRRPVPRTSIRMGTALRSLDRSGEGVLAEFSDGVAERFDAVVGADGTRSSVRALVDAGELEARGTATWAFRADPDFETPDHAAEVWCPDGTVFLFVPLDDGALVRLSAACEPGECDASASTLREVSGGIDWLLPDLLRCLDGEVCHDEDYRVRASARVDGRVALVGDAAHALHPVAGVSAALALEDAYVLANELRDRERALGARLREYADRRRRRVGRLGRQAHRAAALTFAGTPDPDRDAAALRSDLLDAVSGRGPAVDPPEWS